MEVRIKIKTSGGKLPERATEGAAGYDIRARLSEDVVLRPGERALIPTGLYMEIPRGYEAQMRPRSGLALKHGVTLINGVGTIDSDYRGEISIPLINLGDEDFTVSDGERIAQMIISGYASAEWDEESGFTSTRRDTGGFGHTGK